MARPTETVRAAYEAQLRQIHSRLNAARMALLHAESLDDIERAALDLRKALELLAYSGLITHKADLGPISKSLAKADAGDARKRIEAINPNWWPKPQDITPGGPADVQATISGHHESDFMTADEWGSAYGLASDPLHTRNPLHAVAVDFASTKKALARATSRLRRLLQAHTLDLGEAGYLLLGRFDDDNVQVVALTKEADE